MLKDVIQTLTPDNFILFYQSIQLNLEDFTNSRKINYMLIIEPPLIAIQNTLKSGSFSVSEHLYSCFT